MAESPVFDRVCTALEERSDLDRLQARGTVRIALKKAGFEVTSVDVSQMDVVLKRVLPGELEVRGVEGSAKLAEALAGVLADVDVEAAPDRASRAAATFARFGS